MTAGKIGVEENIGLNSRWGRFTRLRISILLVLMYPHPSSHLIGLGEYTAVSEAIISVSSCGRFGFDSSSFALSVVDPTSLLGDVDFFSSFNLFSSPSTLFNNASKTSVFGPLFLGTASSERQSSS